MTRVALCVFVLASWCLPAFGQSASQEPLPTSSAETSTSLEQASAELQQRVFQLIEHPSDPDAGRRAAMETYNLGTKFLSGGDPGPAHAWLSLANRLAPEDGDAQRNLGIAKKQLESRIGKDQVIQGRAPWEEWIPTPTAVRLLQFLGLSLAVLAMGFTVLRKADQEGAHLAALQHLRPSPAATVGLALGLAFILGAQILSWDSSDTQTAVLNPATLRSGPADSFVDLGNVPAGAILPVLDARASRSGTGGRWIQVRYASSKVAWIPESACLPLSKYWP